MHRRPKAPLQVPRLSTSGRPRETLARENPRRHREGKARINSTPRRIADCALWTISAPPTTKDAIPSNPNKPTAREQQIDKLLEYPRDKQRASSLKKEQWE